MQKTLKSWRVRPVWPLTTTAIGVCVPPVMGVERGTPIGHRRRLFFQIEFSGSPGGALAAYWVVACVEPDTVPTRRRRCATRRVAERLTTLLRLSDKPQIVRRRQRGDERRLVQSGVLSRK